MKCARCGKEFEYPGFKTDICGNCADDLRQEEDAEIQAKIAEDEAQLRAKMEEEDARQTFEQRGN